MAQNEWWRSDDEPLCPPHHEPFADPFLDAEHEAELAGGEVVLLPDGRLTIRTRGRVIEGTVLPPERVAAPSRAWRAAERETARELVRRGTRWLDTLIPVESAVQSGLAVPDAAPDGWYLRTARSRTHGDYLHAVVVLLTETGLYHTYLWQFVCHQDGEDTLLPLRTFLGLMPTLSHHGVHVYTTGQGTVLCLSRRPLGGLPQFEDALARTVQWLDGAGYAIRGRRFPYVS